LKVSIEIPFDSSSLKRRQSKSAISTRMVIFLT